MLLLSLGLASGFSASTPGDSDWPQLAREAGRTAHALNGVPPPYRARWIWCGPERTLRNKAANPAWPDDLAIGTRAGVDYLASDSSQRAQNVEQFITQYEDGSPADRVMLPRWPGPARSWAR